MAIHRNTFEYHCWYFLNISFFKGGLELMVDEVHVSLPGTKQQGWTKLLFNGNQVIENKLGCCLSIAYNMTEFFELNFKLLQFS